MAPADSLDVATSPDGGTRDPRDGGAARTPRSNPVSRKQVSALAEAAGCYQPESATRPCLTPHGPLRIGHYWAIEGTYCLGRSGLSRTLRFGSGVELEFTVVDANGATGWSSLRDHPARPAPHEVTVTKTECPQWETRWNRRGDDGSRPPGGTYTLRMRVLSPDGADALLAPRTFTPPA